MKNFQNKTKIVKISKVLRTLSLIGLYFWGIGALAFLFCAILPFVLNLLSSPKPTPVLWPPLPKIESVIFFNWFVDMVLWFMVTLHFFRFFDRLKMGHFFDAKTVENLALAGKWWLGVWLFELIFPFINHQIHPDTKISIDDIFGLSNLFGGLFVIFIAWLFREAQELQEEQELTV